MRSVELDLDAMAEAEKAEWHFSLTWGGRCYPTRPLDLSDLLAMQPILHGAKTADDAEAAALAIDRLRGWVLSMIDGDKPDLSGASLAVLLSVAAHAARYFAAFMRAKTQAIRGGQ